VRKILFPEKSTPGPLSSEIFLHLRHSLRKGLNNCKNGLSREITGIAGPGNATWSK
jgi:hypothetical protein